jgi:hypothetical protein
LSADVHSFGDPELPTEEEGTVLKVIGGGFKRKTAAVLLVLLTLSGCHWHHRHHHGGHGHGHHHHRGW